MYSNSNSFNYPNAGRNYHFVHNSNNLGINMNNINLIRPNLNNNLNNENNNVISSINNLNHNLNNNLTNTYGNNKNFTNVNIFGFNKPNQNIINNTNITPLNRDTNFSKFLSNVGPNYTTTQQERAINFGQDPNENSFKKNLRKPTVSNLIQNTSYNIISGVPLGNNLNNQIKFNTNAMNKLNNKGGLEDLFYAFKNNKEINKDNNNQYTPNINQNGETLIPVKDLQTNLKNIQNIKHNQSNQYYTTTKSIPILPINYQDYSIKDGFSVKEYSYKEEQNSRFRDHMEDMHKVIDKFSRDLEKGLFTLLDGHGGAEVAKIALDRIPEVFESLLTQIRSSHGKKTNEIENLLEITFHKVDDEIKLSNYDNMGCTATVVFITKEKDLLNQNNSRKVAYCANVGDSRCVIISNYGAKRLSYDHKASDPPEVARILNAGGVVFAGRVFGQLILSRALGDHALKKYGVISTPFVTKHFISDRDKYIVLASDGVWDVITDDDIYRFSLSVSNSEEFVSLILKNSIGRGSQDNISCIVIKLN